MPPKRKRGEDNGVKSIEDMNESELEVYVQEKAKEMAELSSCLEKANSRLLELQKSNDTLSVEDRFTRWNDNGLTKQCKSLSELRKTIIGDLLCNALNDGCVNRHETKTADCILEIIYDYSGGSLSEKDNNMLQYLMDNNIGEITFD